MGITFAAMRIKRTPGFTIRSLFSRRSKRRDRKSTTIAEAGLPHSRTIDSAPTTAAAQTTTGPNAIRYTPSSASQQSTLPLEKGLEVLGLRGDPRTAVFPPPIDLRLVAHSASLPHPQAERACTLNQTTSGGPIVVVPVVQDAPHTFLDMSGGRTATRTTAAAAAAAAGGRERRDTLILPSPLLPPLPPSLPQSCLPDPPHSHSQSQPSVSASPTRLTSTTRSSGTLPWWGLELPTQPSRNSKSSAPIADSLSEDHILVLPSPPSIARFSARES